MATAACEYVECDIYDIPDGVRFDTPRRNQGQIVTVSYGAFGRSEAGWGAPYMHRHDASDGAEQYYRRADVAAATAEVRTFRQQRSRQQRERTQKAAVLSAVLPRLAQRGVTGVRCEGEQVVALVRGCEARTSLSLVRAAASEESYDISTYGVIAERVYTDLLAVLDAMAP